MANKIITAMGLTREALRLLTNNLAFSRNIYKGYSNSNFGNADPKEGDTLNVRVPTLYKSTVGSALDVQDIEQSTVSVKLTTQRHVDIQFSSKELALDIDDFSDLYLKSAMATLANDIDFDALKMYQQVYNYVGTPGTTPKTALVILKGGMTLNNYGVPMDGSRTAIINPMAEAYMVDSLKGLFQDSSTIAKQYRQGMMGRGLGFNFEMDQNVNTHTAGHVDQSTAHVRLEGNVSEGATQLKIYYVDENPTPYLNVGDIFTIDHVFGVNPMNKQSLNELQSFTVRNPTHMDGDRLVVDFAPTAHWEPTAKQNISTRPLHAMNVSFAMGNDQSYPQNLLFHKDAFCSVFANLPVPSGVDFAAAQSDEGISMRIIRDYTISSDSFPCRIDVLYGHKCIRPEMACRLIG